MDSRGCSMDGVQGIQHGLGFGEQHRRRAVRPLLLQGTTRGIIVGAAHHRHPRKPHELAPVDAESALSIGDRPLLFALATPAETRFAQGRSLTSPTRPRLHVELPMKPPCHPAPVSAASSPPQQTGRNPGVLRIPRIPACKLPAKFTARLACESSRRRLPSERRNAPGHRRPGATAQI